MSNLATLPLWNAASREEWVGRNATTTNSEATLTRLHNSNPNQIPLAGPGRCARLDSPADQMRLIDAVLDGLAAQGFELGPRERQANLRGTACAVSLRGGDPGFLHYQLQTTAEEGYVFALVPTGKAQYELIARAAQENEERGVLIAGVEHIRVSGRFRPGDSSLRLRRIMGLEPGNLSPDAVRAQLQQLGYRARFVAEDTGWLNVEVDPGRSIRRVRIHGHIPLSKRDVQRELSVNARPGALAQGACASPKAARNAAICQPDDLACVRWQEDEITRLKRGRRARRLARGHRSGARRRDRPPARARGRGRSPEPCRSIGGSSDDRLVAEVAGGPGLSEPAVLLLDAAPHVLHHRPRQPPGDGGQQRRVVAQAHRHRLLRAPLSDGAAPPVPGPRWYKLPVLAASHPRLARQRAALSHGGGLAGD